MYYSKKEHQSSTRGNSHSVCDSVGKKSFTKHRSQKFDISFINLQTSIILQNLKQTITCINHKSIHQNCIRKNYKTTKHSDKIHILQKYTKKN